MDTHNTEIPRANWIPVIEGPDIGQGIEDGIRDGCTFVAPSDRGQTITIIRYHEYEPNQTITLFPSVAAELTKTMIDLIAEQ
jgi:hypothetical protein